jgi:hypothetical protein
MGVRTAVSAVVVALAIVVPGAHLPRAGAQGQTTDPQGTLPIRLRYTFQPDCLRRSIDAVCDTPKATKHLDFGPQIAVWIEDAKGTLIDTLMVTNATAVWGIGNRPGYWRFPSNWRFPYGKRKMVLPVWAHARGRLYDTLLMQDDDGVNKRELWLGFHEEVSSPDPYYCLSFRPASWVLDAETVDAISCPTGVFNSAKGRFSPSEPKSYYPPRNDLTKVTPNDCDFARMQPCPGTSASKFAELNDLDVVASATPPYGRVFTGIWTVPAELADGNYSLALEVNKEFDTNTFHTHDSFVDSQLPDNGLKDNFGQPSVVFKVPFHLDRSKPVQATAMDMAGYGDWDGETGGLHPPDATISSTPGSGQGRLLVIPSPAIAGGQPVQGRLHVVTELPTRPEECIGLPADNGRIARVEIPMDSVTATEAEVSFIEAADRGMSVEQYEIRYREGESMTPETFRQSTPAASPMPGAPGGRATIKLIGLKPATNYIVGVRARGGCVMEGPLSVAPFSTHRLVFTQLSGCFVATAAYGSALEPQVESLRRARDQLRARSGFGAAAVGIYERSSPPLAALLRETEAGRALIRAAISPLSALAARAAAIVPVETPRSP